MPNSEEKITIIDSLNKDTKKPQAQEFNGLYIGYYNEGNVNLRQKSFRCDGILRAAINRFKEHCEIMGYRFRWVQPFLSDLELEERYHLGLNAPATRSAAEIANIKA